MMLFLKENLGSIIIGLIILAVVIMIILNMVKNKKKGKSSCGCGCSNCAMNGACHTKDNSKDKK